MMYIILNFNYRLSKIKHENIVDFIGISFAGGGKPTLIMEYLPISLNKYLETNKKISAIRKTCILLDISHGLQYLHGQHPPIIHRDLTSNNVLLTDRLKAKIADLGASRAFNRDPGLSRYAYMSACPGNPYHMPPEALATPTTYRIKHEDVDKLDIFSLGNIILHICTHTFPSVLPAYCEDTHMPRSEVERRQHLFKLMMTEEVSQDLRAFCTSCLNNIPQQRPSTTDAVQFFQSELQKITQLQEISGIG